MEVGSGESFQVLDKLAVSFRKDYTLVNQHSWLENGPGMKMCFHVPACYVLVYQRVYHLPTFMHVLGCRNLNQSGFHGMSCSRIYVSAYGFMKILSIHPPKKY